METPNNKKRISKERLEEYAKSNQFYFWQLCEQYRINDKEYYEEVAKPLLENYKQKEYNKAEGLKHKSRYLIYALLLVLIVLIGISYYFWSKAYEFNQERKALKDSLIELDREYTTLKNKYKREVKEKENKNDKFVPLGDLNLEELIPYPSDEENEKNVESYQKNENHLYFTDDRDGKKYKYVKIGKQTWMAENLNTTKYRNGDPIPNVTDYREWNSLTTGAYCNYNNANTSYGKLYNWYTVKDKRNIAPVGWHVPTDDEWQTLVDYLGGVSQAGRKLKEGEFIALLGGCRNLVGSFDYLSKIGFWWSSTECYTSNTPGSYYRIIQSVAPSIIRSDIGKSVGFSVRCIKD